MFTGITDFNTTAAYAKMRDNAVNPNQPKDARGELDVYMAYGDIPLEDDERGTCETLAKAYNDWAISVIAGILGYTEDVPIFAERALNYRNSFSTEELFMCPRYRVSGISEDRSPEGVSLRALMRRVGDRVTAA